MREKAVLTFRSLPKSYSVDALLPAKGDDSDSDSSSSDGESESGKAKLGSISLSPFWYSSKLFGQPASYGQSTVHSRYEAGQPSRCPHWQSVDPDRELTAEPEPVAVNPRARRKPRAMVHPLVNRLGAALRPKLSDLQSLVTEAILQSGEPAPFDKIYSYVTRKWTGLHSGSHLPVPDPRRQIRNALVRPHGRYPLFRHEPIDPDSDTGEDDCWSLVRKEGTEEDPHQVITTTTVADGGPKKRGRPPRAGGLAVPGKDSGNTSRASSRNATPSVGASRGAAAADALAAPSRAAPVVTIDPRDVTRVSAYRTAWFDEVRPDGLSEAELHLVSHLLSNKTSDGRGSEDELLSALSKSWSVTRRKDTAENYPSDVKRALGVILKAKSGLFVPLGPGQGWRLGEIPSLDKYLADDAEEGEEEEEPEKAAPPPPDASGFHPQNMSTEPPAAPAAPAELAPAATADADAAPTDNSTTVNTDATTTTAPTTGQEPTNDGAKEAPAPGADATPAVPENSGVDATTGSTGPEGESSADAAVKTETEQPAEAEVKPMQQEPAEKVEEVSERRRTPRLGAVRAAPVSPGAPSANDPAAQASSPISVERLPHALTADGMVEYVPSRVSEIVEGPGGAATLTPLQSVAKAELVRLGGRAALDDIMPTIRANHACLRKRDGTPYPSSDLKRAVQHALRNRGPALAAFTMTTEDGRAVYQLTQRGARIGLSVDVLYFPAGITLTEGFVASVAATMTRGSGAGLTPVANSEYVVPGQGEASSLALAAPTAHTEAPLSPSSVPTDLQAVIGATILANGPQSMSDLVEVLTPVWGTNVLLKRDGTKFSTEIRRALTASMGTSTSATESFGRTEDNKVYLLSPEAFEATMRAYVEYKTAAGVTEFGPNIHPERYRDAQAGDGSAAAGAPATATNDGDVRADGGNGNGEESGTVLGKRDRDVGGGSGDAQAMDTGATAGLGDTDEESGAKRRRRA